MPYEGVQRQGTMLFCDSIVRFFREANQGPNCQSVKRQLKFYKTVILNWPASQLASQLASKPPNHPNSHPAGLERMTQGPTQISQTNKRELATWHFLIGFGEGEYGGIGHIKLCLVSRGS